MEIDFNELHKTALICCIELVLMNQVNTKYNLVAARLNYYNITMRDSYKQLDYFKRVLKEVYGDDYNRILNEIKLHLGGLVEEQDIANFFKIMEN
jgi:hypothetical protein